MLDYGWQTRRVALTRGLTRTAKWWCHKLLTSCCESATLVLGLTRVEKKTHPLYTPHAWARVRPRMRKGLKRESQSRRLATPTALVGHVPAPVGPRRVLWPPAYPPTTCPAAPRGPNVAKWPKVPEWQGATGPPGASGAERPAGTAAIFN